MTFYTTIPYNELPVIPPIEELDSKQILKATVRAHRAMAELKGSMARLPNPSILLDSISYQEAKVSSEIENILTTNDELYQYAISDRKTGESTAKEVLYYREALWHGFTELQTRGILTTNLFTQIVQIIKKNDAGIRNTPGTKIIRNGSGEVLYTPPTGEALIREKLANLEQYLNTQEDDTDPLVKMAIAHYQFEAIHPFIDGNGRTGRIINILYLIQQGLLPLPVLYLSRYILENRSTYYQLLQSVTTEQTWERWIIFMITAVEETSKITCQKIEAIHDAMNRMANEMKSSLPKIYSKDLVELLFRRPYSKRQFLVEANIVMLRTAGAYMAALEKEGFLTGVEVGREKLFLNRELLEILRA